MGNVKHYMQMLSSTKNLTFLFTALFAGILVSGCSGTQEVKENEPPPKELIAKVEETFKPSDYDRDPARIREEDERGKPATPAEKTVPASVSSTVRGYRVQVLFTQDIEQANRLRDTITSVLPQEYVYIVYDAPYYKVRVGNFVEKTEANSLLRSLTGQGYRDAWVVPDNVLTNLPPKEQPGPPVEEQH